MSNTKRPSGHTIGHLNTPLMSNHFHIFSIKIAQWLECQTINFLEWEGDTNFTFQTTKMKRKITNIYRWTQTIFCCVISTNFTWLEQDRLKKASSTNKVQITGMYLIYSSGFYRMHQACTVTLLQDPSRHCITEVFPNRPEDKIERSFAASGTGIIENSTNSSLISFILSSGREVKKFLRASLIQSYRQSLNASLGVSCKGNKSSFKWKSQNLLLEAIGSNNISSFAW